MLSNGWRIIESGASNWILAKGDDDEPFVLPMRGRVLSMAIMEKIGEVVDHAAIVQAVSEK